MSEVNWCDILGWNANHLSELRATGYSFLKEGKYDQAKIYFEALVVLDPSSVYDIQTLGALHLLMGNLAEAIETLDKALVLNPDHAGSRLNRAKALLYIGKVPEGLEAARELIHCPQQDIANDAQALILAYS
jgi:tetratricopeptide (TPR) repeat protein